MILQINVPSSLTESPLFKAGVKVVETLKKAGFTAYFAGGAPRDILLGRKMSDVDVATDALPEEVMKLFEKAIPVGASFGVVTVIVEGVSFEVATFRVEKEYSDGRHPDKVFLTRKAEDDVLRRDFTINAMLLDPVTSKLYDFTGGIEDMKKGVLRAVGDPFERFSEDHLRILRAIRFGARLNYVIEPKTKKAIKSLAPKLVKISPERIRAELEKMLLDKHAETAFRLMASLGVLRAVLPEVDALQGIAQPKKYHPEGDVFTHTMLMIGHASWRTPEICWSALLHDVGKPSTQTFAEDGTPHFYGHEAVGADVAENVLRRLRAPAKLCSVVGDAVRNHMRFAFVDKMKPSKWKKMLSSENFPTELELNRLDCLCSNKLLGNYVLMLDRMRELEKAAGSTQLPAPFLTGKDLINAGYRSGPVIGRILSEVIDLQLDGRLKTKKEAEEHVEKFFGSEKS